LTTSETYDDATMAGVPTTERGHWMQVRDGRIFYPLDPRPEEVFLEDIGYSLARKVRFGGFADQQIPVSQHLCQCQWMALQEGYGVREQYAILMHDAPEYIVGDMIRPLKVDMPEFKLAEQRIAVVVNEALDVPTTVPHSVIKYFDNLAWAWEKRDLYKSSLEWPNTPVLPDYCYTMKPWGVENAYNTFMTQARLLRVASNAMQEFIDGQKQPVDEEDTIENFDLFDEGTDDAEPRWDTRDWRSK